MTGIAVSRAGQRLQKPLDNLRLPVPGLLSLIPHRGAVCIVLTNPRGCSAPRPRLIKVDQVQCVTPSPPQKLPSLQASRWASSWNSEPRPICPDSTQRGSLLCCPRALLPMGPECFTGKMGLSGSSGQHPVREGGIPDPRTSPVGPSLLHIPASFS